MTALLFIFAGIMAAGAWCAVSHTGETEKICKYGYINEEEENHENLC